MESINYKIIQIALRQYFCNIENLTEEQEVLSYYYKLLELVHKNPYTTWGEIGSDFIIWEPFENTSPSDVLDNIQNIYEDIEVTLNLESPNIVINPYEVAEQLSKDSVKADLIVPFAIYKNGKDGEYTEKALSLYKEYHDYYVATLTE